jgi:hypothetical protein
VQSIIKAYESFNSDGPANPPETDTNHKG